MTENPTSHDSSDPHDSPKASHSGQKFAWSCGLKSFGVVGGGLAALLTLAAAIDHKAELAAVLDALIWLSSFGGSFWGAVASATVGISVALASFCMLEGREEGAQSRRFPSLPTAFLVIGLVVWALAGTFAFGDAIDAERLTIYQTLARGIWYAPLLPVAALLLGGICMAAADS